MSPHSINFLINLNVLIVILVTSKEYELELENENEANSKRAVEAEELLEKINSEFEKLKQKYASEVTHVEKENDQMKK